MQKLIAVFMAVFCIFGFTACSREKDGSQPSYVGLNAKITEIDAENRQLKIKDLSEIAPVVFGENCIIDCKDAILIYCNYDTGEVYDVNFDDLMVDDEIILNVKMSEISKLKSGEPIISAEQLQLGTQRLE